MNRNAAESSGPSDGPAQSPGLWRFALGLAAILVVWVACGRQAYHDFVFHLGSIHEPTVDWMAVVTILSAFGVPATYLGLRLLLPFFSARRLEVLRAYLMRGGQSWRAGLGIVLVGALLPLAIRYGLLHQVPWTDDEGSYRFQAQLLASGRVWIRSPAMPVFFDNAFLVNDGKMFSQYFLGWPFLLSLGFRIKLPMLVNPLLSGLTALLLGLIAKRRLGPTWGSVAALVYLCSPFMQVSASTNMSHTSSSFALTLALFAADRSIAGDARKRITALLALSACLAFWIRPATAFGFATPLVLSWMFSLRRLGVRRAAAHLGVFVLVATGPALMFLWVNQQQTGSLWHTGYHAIIEYAASNGYRFMSFGPHEVDTKKFLFFFMHVTPGEILTKYVVVMVRLWTESWGFPIGFALALLGSRTGTRLLLAPFLGLLVAHVPLRDAGIDTFGPVHYTELMILLTLASTAGLQRLYRAGVKLGQPGLAPALWTASVACGFVFYGFMRFNTLAVLAQDLRAPMDAFERAPPQSVVFYYQPFAPICMAPPANHFVWFRPNNDPELRNPRLWANHIDLDSDRKLLASMPGRRGFIMRHDPRECRMVLVPLEQATPEQFPPRVYLLPGDLGDVPRPHSPDAK